MKKIFMLCVLALVSATAFAQDITVVYQGRSKVNSKATSFIKSEAKSNKLPYKFIFKSGLDSINGDEKVLVLLNTGREEGMDPEIVKFISSSKNKESIILLSFYSVGKETFVEVVPATDSSIGVDEISAASQWKAGKSNPVRHMHEQWAEELFAMIKIKEAR